LPRGHLRSARAPRLRAAGLCTAGNHGENNVPHASPSAGQENRFDVLILYGAITADTDLRLCRFFGLSNGYWLRAQAAYDTEVAMEELAEELDSIRPWKDTGSQSGHHA